MNRCPSEAVACAVGCRKHHDRCTWPEGAAENVDQPKNHEVHRPQSYQQCQVGGVELAAVANCARPLGKPVAWRGSSSGLIQDVLPTPQRT